MKIPEGAYIERNVSIKDKLLHAAVPEKTRSELAAEEIAVNKEFLRQQMFRNVYGMTVNDWAAYELERVRALERIKIAQRELEDTVREELAIHMRPTY